MAFHRSPLPVPHSSRPVRFHNAAPLGSPFSPAAPLGSPRLASPLNVAAINRGTAAVDAVAHVAAERAAQEAAAEAAVQVTQAAEMAARQAQANTEASIATLAETATRAAGVQQRYAHAKQQQAEREEEVQRKKWYAR